MADLSEEPFSFNIRKGDVVDLRFRGRPVKTLRAKQAIKFLNQIERMDVHESQLLMARVTGQFKMGNEREGKDNDVSQH